MNDGANNAAVAQHICCIVPLGSSFQTAHDQLEKQYLLMLLTSTQGTLEVARACSHSLAPSIASSPWLHSSTYALATRQASC